jgi:AhpD family alkylhydroperoxidase
MSLPAFPVRLISRNTLADVLVRRGNTRNSKEASALVRVAPVTGRRAPLLLRLLNIVSRRAMGGEMAPLQVMAHNPGFLLPYLATLPLVRGRAALDPAVRALAMQLVAQINGCSWCIDFGRAEADKDGVPPAKLLAVADYATDPRFSPPERAALAYADAVTQVGARVSDDVFGQLRRYFSEREIVELTVAVAMENCFNRINVPLEIEAQGFCPVSLSAAVALQAT